jgi:hypothetical protein
MSIEVAASIWNLVNDSLPADDRETLAASLLDILIDEGYEASDIEYNFSEFPEVMDALKVYLDGDESYDEREEKYDDDDEEW